MVVNILLTSFPGLGLPSTLCLPLPSSNTFADLYHSVDALLPHSLDVEDFILTHSGRQVPKSDQTLSDSISTPSTGSDNANTMFYPVTLTARLCGGKGGFGSQLRAAGGRMSSRKRKQNAEQATASSRNLDGRRLRTITEAKNLATYLATKPDADRKEKEEKRKRWEQVVAMAESREADMKNGKTVDGRRIGLSSAWLEEKEEVGENVKGAVRAALKEHSESDSEKSLDSDVDSEDEEQEVMELDESDMVRLRVEAEKGDQDALWVLEKQLKIPKELLPQQKTQKQSQTKRFAGFDEDDSSSDEETVKA